MTLTQTERGYAPPVEHVGKPERTRQMMGTDWKENRRMLYVHYPWLKSQYLHERKNQLSGVLNELMPHKPVSISVWLVYDWESCMRWRL